MAILFYSTRAKWGEFSNFYQAKIEVDGKTYPTSEHYFQAQKYAGVNPEREEQIRNAPDAKTAAKMGRDRSYPLRADWEAVKDDVMLTALRAKFSQHPKLRETLLATGDEELIEDTSDDYYWGWGTNHTGKNMLGILLMQLRDEIRRSV
jgi:N-glycosidase YbiA